MESELHTGVIQSDNSNSTTIKNEYDIKGISFEQWIELGRQLKAVRAYLMDEHIRLANEYGKSKPPAKKYERALAGIERVRDVLDDKVFDLFPEKSTQELAGVFYGEIKEAA